MKWCLFLALCACKTTSEAKSEAQATLSSESKLFEEGDLSRMVAQGPETITTTTEEWAEKATAPGGAVAGLPTGAGALSLAGRKPTVPPVPLLVKRTVVVDQRGPASSETHLNAQAATETHATAHLDAKAEAAKKSGPAGLLGSLLGLWPLLLVGGVAALAFWRKDLLGAVIKKLLP